MTKKQRQAAEDQLSMHAGSMGFDWKGPGVRRSAVWVVASLLAIATLGLLIWLALSFPGQLLGKTQEAVNKGTTIERKLDDFKRDTRKHNRRTDKALEDLSQAVSGIEEALQRHHVTRDADKHADLGQAK